MFPEAWILHTTCVLGDVIGGPPARRPKPRGVGGTNPAVTEFELSLNKRIFYYSAKYCVP